MSMTATPTRLTREDLRAFDGQATRLILEMGEHEWEGRISNKGHAIMRAPDGTSTASVARDSNRGRSGANARAHFERWKREQRVRDYVDGIEGTPEADLPHACECGLRFSTKQALGAHSKVHSLYTIQCAVCFKPVRYVNAHMRRHHPTETG